MKQKSGFILQKIVGEDILVPIGANVMNINGLITLNEVAVYLWELLAQEQSKEELYNSLIAHFDVNPDDARKDLEKFLDEITAIGIIET